MISLDAIFNFYVISAFGALIAIIVSLAVLSTKSAEKAKESESTISKIISQVPIEKQTLFILQYENVKKSTSTALLYALFLGGLGAHKFYLNKTGLGIVYLVFSWSLIPTIIAYIEALAMNAEVGAYNEQKAREIGSAIFGRLI